MRPQKPSYCDEGFLISVTDYHYLYAIEFELWMLRTIVIGFQNSFFSLNLYLYYLNLSSLKPKN
ncbi:hypothetical protein VCR17J2_660011 [Vibrio coralliirubri]|nr:hypothetical protein VCR17J2_660011 [Vibrio coralliirubri]